MPTRSSCASSRRATACSSIAPPSRWARSPDEPGATVRLATSLAGASVALALLTVAAHDRLLLVAGAIAAGGLLATAANPYRPLLRARLAMLHYFALVAGQAAVGVALFAIVVIAG